MVDHRAAAVAALEAGRPIAAVDHAVAARRGNGRDLRTAHVHIMALARAGARSRAEAEYQALDLDQRRPTEDPALAVDLLALGARLAKDRALSGAHVVDRGAAERSAARYVQAAELDQTGYAAINAATMSLLAGDRQAASTWARRALADAAEEQAPVGDEQSAPYWRSATRAEAHVVLGDNAAAEQELREAERQAGGDLGAKASTRRQLLALAEVVPVPARLIDRLVVPGVVAFGGHRLHAGADDEAALTEQVATVLDRRRAGIGYGALACGADLLWAEALLQRGADLHVTLPCDRAAFVDVSVRPGGAPWVDRFWQVLHAATSVAEASAGTVVHDAHHRFAADRFLGGAVLHARDLTVEPAFCVIWDGVASSGTAGTGADVARWSASGRALEVVAPQGARVRSAAKAPAVPWAVKAALFGDFDGFGDLHDDQLPGFVESALGAVADVLEGDRDGIDLQSTWGDGLYVVCDSVAVAARVALGLHSSTGSSSGWQLRLGGNVGPMFPLHEPVEGRDSWWGRSVVTAARVEPTTPEGETYVTESFAALLALEPDAAARAEYVGEVATAKGFGEMGLYVLRAVP